MSSVYDPRNPNWPDGVPPSVGHKSSLMILREQTAQICSQSASILTRLGQIEARLSAGNTFDADQRLIQQQAQTIVDLKKENRELRNDRGQEISGHDGRSEGIGCAATVLLAGLPETGAERDSGGCHRRKRSRSFRLWRRSTA